MKAGTKLLLLAVAVAGVCWAGLRFGHSPTYTVLHNFTRSNGPGEGCTPTSPPLAGRDGVLYGTTWEGGANGQGTVFSITTSGVFRVLHSFGPPADKACCPAGVVQGKDGNLYGATLQGGIVYRLTTNGAFTVIHSFTGGPDGQQPLVPLFPTDGHLLLAADGSMYGITSGGRPGGTNYGAVYRVATNATFAILHTFAGGEDGAYPNALAQARNGSLYGTTESGVLFRVATDGMFSTLKTFPGSRSSCIFEGWDGNMYGVIDDALFKVALDTGVSVLHSFTGGSEGADPSNLLQTPDGTLYGLTDSGGQSNAGTVFRLATNGTFTLLHSFTGGKDGASPNTMLRVEGGSLCGFTRQGGEHGAGTVFRITAGGTFRILCSLPQEVGEDHRVVGGDGADIYGVTSGGGEHESGMLFRVLSKLPLLHTIMGGGKREGGILFRVSENHGFTILHTFGGRGDGFGPTGLVWGPDGNLYGTTLAGDDGSCLGGTIFRVTVRGRGK